MATCDEHIIKKTISGIFMLVKTVGNSLFFLFMPFVFSVLSFCYTKSHYGTVSKVQGESTASQHTLFCTSDMH